MYNVFSSKKPIKNSKAKNYVLCKSVYRKCKFTLWQRLFGFLRRKIACAVHIVQHIIRKIYLRRLQLFRHVNHNGIVLNKCGHSSFIILSFHQGGYRLTDVPQGRRRTLDQSDISCSRGRKDLSRAGRGCRCLLNNRKNLENSHFLS